MRFRCFRPPRFCNAIDKDKYEVVPIGITKEGRWLTAADAENLLQGKLVHRAASLTRRRS